MVAVLQTYYFIQIVLKLKTNAATTRTVWLSNSPALVVDTATYNALPIIKSISGVGCRMDNYTAKNISGTITLDNKIGSAGHQKKVSDNFDLYTPIDQTVKIYYVEDYTGAVASSGYTADSDDVILSTTIKAIESNINELKITTNPIDILTAYANQIISTQVIGAYTLEGAGAHSPIIFGEHVPVVPILTAARLIVTTLYYYFMTGTSVSNDDGSEAIFLQDDPAYYEVTVQREPIQCQFYSGTKAIEMNRTTAGGASDWSVLDVVADAGGVVFSRIEDSTDGEHNFGITAIGLWIGQETSELNDPDGSIIIKICEAGSYWPKFDQPIATGEVTSSDFSSTTNEYVFYLDKPAFLDADKTYYICAQHIQNDTSRRWGRVRVQGSDITGQVIAYDLTTGTEVLDSAVLGSSFRIKYYGINFLTHTMHDIGVPGRKAIGCSFSTASDRVIDLSAYDFTLYMSGIKDDDSGTITGTASAYITEPQHCIKFLAANNVGSGVFIESWLDNTLFSSTFSAANRNISGGIYKKVSILAAIEEICRQSKCKLGKNISDNSFGAYVMGASYSIIDYIFDKDIIAFDYYIKDSKTVLNNLTMIGDFNYISPKSRDTSVYSRLPSEFKYTITDATSISLFGDKVLGKESFDILATDDFDAIAKIILTNNALPEEYIKITVPYLKAKDYNILDVISITSAYLPAEFGSTTNQELLTWEDSGAVKEATCISGVQMVRASETKAQIYDIVFNTDLNQPATIELVCRVVRPTDII